MVSTFAKGSRYSYPEHPVDRDLDGLSLEKNDGSSVEVDERSGRMDGRGSDTMFYRRFHQDTLWPACVFARKLRRVRYAKSSRSLEYPEQHIIGCAAIQAALTNDRIATREKSHCPQDCEFECTVQNGYTEFRKTLSTCISLRRLGDG